MLRVLMDHHRARGRDKRGGDRVRLSLSKVDQELAQEPEFEIPALVEALERLETLAPRTADVTKLRLLWGFAIQEVADTLSLSVSTVEREWRFARHWLASALRSR
jgi:RNA polymerase sigma factor (TIGR02999 family)